MNKAIQPLTITGAELLRETSIVANRQCDATEDSHMYKQQFEAALIRLLEQQFDTLVEQHNTAVTKYYKALEDIAELNTKHTLLLDKYYTAFKEPA